MLIFNIILGILIVALILIQGRGAGLGSAWGGGGEFQQYWRGLEKLFLYLTAALVAAFLIVSLINIVI